MKSRWHPSKWTARFYVVVALGLAALNLLGANGFIHWVLLRQEARRLETAQLSLQRRLDAVLSDTRHFRASKVAKERAIRDELGYLKPDEISVEISR